MDQNTEFFLQRLKLANFIVDEIKELLFTRGQYVSYKKIFNELNIDFVDMGFKTLVNLSYRFEYFKIDKKTGLIVQPGSGMYNKMSEAEKNIKYEDFLSYCIANATKKWLVAEKKKGNITVL